MRILFLSEAISPHISRWQTEFQKLGWEALVASCDFDSRFAGHKLAAKVSRGPFRYLSIVAQIRQMVEEYSPHLVNAHFLPSYGLATALAKVHPFTLTLWGSDILVSGSSGFLSRLRSRFVLNRADLVVGDSNYLIAEAARIHPLARRLVVSFGAKRAWYESGKARELADAGRLEIISTRRFESIYDIETLVKAAKILADERFPYHLTIVGCGTQESRLKGLVSRLELNSHIDFTGRLSSERLFSAYRNADVYVSTARSDSTSVSLLEAMSQKLYPVVTDVPGNREWLESDDHLFTVSDACGLAVKIKRGLSTEARVKAYEAYEPALRQRGVREEQMKAAHLTFLKLIDEYDRR